MLRPLLQKPYMIAIVVLGIASLACASTEIPTLNSSQNQPVETQPLNSNPPVLGATPIPSTPLPQEVLDQFNAQESVLVDVYRRVEPAVVNITVSAKADDGKLTDYAGGSGFVIDNEGHIVTNNHVVESADLERVRFDDGAQLALTSDMNEMRDQLEAIEAGSFGGLMRYLAEGHLHYHLSLRRFVGGERRKKVKRLAKGDDPDGDAATFDVLEALTAFGPIHPDPEAFLEALDPLQPRLYSISSSPLADPGEMHLTVDVVRYELTAGARDLDQPASAVGRPRAHHDRVDSPRQVDVRGEVVLGLGRVRPPGATPYRLGLGARQKAEQVEAVDPGMDDDAAAGDASPVEPLERRALEALAQEDRPQRADVGETLAQRAHDRVEAQRVGDHEVDRRPGQGGLDAVGIGSGHGRGLLQQDGFPCTGGGDAQLGVQCRGDHDRHRIDVGRGQKARHVGLVPAPVLPSGSFARLSIAAPQRREADLPGEIGDDVLRVAAAVLAGADEPHAEGIHPFTVRIAVISGKRTLVVSSTRRGPCHAGFSTRGGRGALV